MKKYIVELTSEERSALEDIVKAERMAAHKRRHARMLLKADQGPLGPAWKDADIGDARVLRYHHAIVPAPKDLGRIPEERRSLYMTAADSSTPSGRPPGRY